MHALASKLCLRQCAWVAGQAQAPGSLKPVPTGCSTNSIAKRLFHEAAGQATCQTHPELPCGCCRTDTGWLVWHGGMQGSP